VPCWWFQHQGSLQHSQVEQQNFSISLSRASAISIRFRENMTNGLVVPALAGCARPTVAVLHESLAPERRLYMRTYEISLKDKVREQEMVHGCGHLLCIVDCFVDSWLPL
jgi:hypothetical protein